MECPFCHQRAGMPYLANACAYAIADCYPVSSGHTLVILRLHAASIFLLDAGALSDVWALVSEVRAALQREFDPAGFTVGVNDGGAAGQTVSHAHVHIIPRYEGDVPDPRGGVRRVISQRAAYWTDCGERS